MTCYLAQVTDRCRPDDVAVFMAFEKAEAWKRTKLEEDPTLDIMIDEVPFEPR